MTAEHLLEVLRSLRSDGIHARSGQAGSGLRRRKLPRVGLRQRVTILPLPADEGHPAVADHMKLTPGGHASMMVRVRNIAPSGLGIICNTPMAIESRFLLVLPRERGGIVHLLGQVKRCRPLDADTWDVGVQIRLDATPTELSDHVRSIRKVA